MRLVLAVRVALMGLVKLVSNLLMIVLMMKL